MTEPAPGPAPGDRAVGVDTALVVARLAKTLAVQLGVGDERAQAVAQRIAEGVQRLWQVEFNKLETKLEELQNHLSETVEELEDVAEWEALIKEWHYTQQDHPGWAVCQHHLCAQVRR